MYRFLAVALTLTLVGEAPQARADMITFDLAGTISEVNGNPHSLPFAVGDRVTWTLQLDRSASPSGTGQYSLSGPLITNIVDQTTGSTLYSLPTGSGDSELTLANKKGSGLFTATDSSNPNYFAKLVLTSSSSFTTLDLAMLPLPFTPGANSTLTYKYGGDSGKSQQFTANVTSFALQEDPGSGGTASTTPEPGALTLFVLGACGLTVRRFRSRLGLAVQRA